MARNSYLPSSRSRAIPIEPLRNTISRFKKQTLLQLRANAITQTVYPTEVYPGYAVVNEARHIRNENSWYSTGFGAKSFRGSVVEADIESEVTYLFQFADYLRYVDIGVGAGVDAEDVDRQRKANYKRRYIRRWSRPPGATRASSHRPFIAMELRHLVTRTTNHLLNFYGYEADFKILPIFDGMKLDLGFDPE